MEDNICAAEFCRNTFEYWNKEEDAGYCGKCVRTLFEEGECDKIETEQTVIDLLEIGEGICERVQTYVEEKKFGEKWKKAVNEINGYKDEAVKIRNELEGSGKTPKEIIKIYSRSNELKSRITNSEAYTKYLKHIDLNYYRLKKAKLASKHDTPSEDEKNSACEEDSKLKELLKFIPSNRRELNELKKSYMDEITKVKNQRANDKDAFEKEKEEWLIQRGEIENEISELNNKLNDSSNKSLVISYDVYNILYKYIIGQSITIDTESCVYFSLNDKKWKILLKILCNFILPPINHYRIDYAPSSSESVRRFMINSLPIQKQFYFNYNNEEQLEASKYIEALKVAAKKTTDSFFVYYTNFSAKEFLELVIAAKETKNLQFICDTIPLDEELDFGAELEGCKIECISMKHSGLSSYSNWKSKPERFENFITGIVKCEHLTKSLKRINIGFCEITKDEAQKVLNKHGLNEVKLEV